MRFIPIIFELVKFFVKRKVALSSVILAGLWFVGAKYLNVEDETALRVMNTILGLDVQINLKVFFITLSIIFFIALLVWVFINKDKRKLNKMKLRLEEEAIETEILKHDLEQKELKEKLNEKIDN